MEKITRLEPTIRPVVGEAEYTLTLARAMISQPENWCQHDFTKEGAFCAVGAIRHLWFLQNVKEEYYGDSWAAKLLAKAIGKRFLSDVGTWNDSPERTHDEVLAVYDAAIAKAKELGV